MDKDYENDDNWTDEEWADAYGMEIDCDHYGDSDADIKACPHRKGYNN